MTTDTQDSLPPIDWIEVGRESHQLSLSRGRSAYLYAMRLAEKAAQNGELEAAQFWRAVYAAIRPR